MSRSAEMLLREVLILAVPIAIFACGMALLSYRFFQAYRRWSFGSQGAGWHLPGILGVALILFAVVIAGSIDWVHAVACIVGGFALAYLYVYFFQMWIEAALLGPILAIASILAMHGTFD
jgi:hypothetical protein